MLEKQWKSKKKESREKEERKKFAPIRMDKYQQSIFGKKKTRWLEKDKFVQNYLSKRGIVSYETFENVQYPNSEEIWQYSGYNREEGDDM